MVDNTGEIRLLVYFHDFKGWESEAAAQDMAASVDYGKKLKKLALVNPPEKEVFHRKLIADLYSGELKIFKESELKEAIEWVKI